MKQVQGAECNAVFVVVFSDFRSFTMFFNIKKCNMEKNATRKKPGPQRASKMESFATIFNGFVNYCCKDVQHGKGAA